MLIFATILYKAIRSPKFFLQLFRKLLQTFLGSKSEMHFFWGIEDCFDLFKPYKDLFNKRIFFYGLVDHDIALQAMSEDDFLINIGNNTSSQLPSKVVEYTSTGKLIVNIVKSDKDSCTINFFKKYPASLCLIEKEKSISLDYIFKVLDFIEKKPIIKPSNLKKFLRSFR